MAILDPSTRTDFAQIEMYLTFHKKSVLWLVGLEKKPPWPHELFMKLLTYLENNTQSTYIKVPDHDVLITPDMPIRFVYQDESLMPPGIISKQLGVVNPAIVIQDELEDSDLREMQEWFELQEKLNETLT